MGIEKGKKEKKKSPAGASGISPQRGKVNRRMSRKKKKGESVPPKDLARKKEGEGGRRGGKSFAFALKGGKRGKVLPNG